MNRRNPAKESFLRLVPQSTVESACDKFSSLAFSLQFFDASQPTGQNFSDWNHVQLVKLLEKLKNYCGSPLEYWRRMPIGHGTSHVLDIYGNFPNKSDFLFPKHVPMDVKWGRFRLEDDMRLPGFIVDPEQCSKLSLASNIFYIVFLDQNHRFCLPEN